ncbi:MAG: hypothetical protein HON90_13090 [Halobacteriovoraceae bacterium]|jgi:esterase/lipase|nr:hypothetical protein [Halobacteriovoraceae bacterium]
MKLILVFVLLTKVSLVLAAIQYDDELNELYNKAQLVSHTCRPQSCYREAADLLSSYKKIRKEAFFTLQNPKATTFVLSHGFTENPQKLKPFADFLVDKGFNVIVLQLSGHTIQSKKFMNFEKLKAKYWLSDIEFGSTVANIISNNVVLAGFSLGGLLSIYQTLKAPEQVDGLFLMSPALGLSGIKNIVTCLPQSFYEQDLFDYFATKYSPGNDSNKIKQMMIGGCKIKEINQKMLDFQERQFLMDESFLVALDRESDQSLRKRVLSDIDVPILLINSAYDEVIGFDNIDTLAQAQAQVESEQLMYYVNKTDRSIIHNYANVFYYETPFGMKVLYDFDKFMELVVP